MQIPLREEQQEMLSWVLGGCSNGREIGRLTDDDIRVQIDRGVISEDRWSNTVVLLIFLVTGGTILIDNWISEFEFADGSTMDRKCREAFLEPKSA